MCLSFLALRYDTHDTPGLRLGNNTLTSPLQLIVAGVRQKSAPIEVRERFSLTEDQLPKALAWLQAHPDVHECAVLTTCNRTEIYAAVERADRGLSAIKAMFRELKQVDYDAYRPSIFTLINEDASLHLFRVASGLDSLIIGEGQILAQVKDALALAQHHKSAGLVLDKLFKAALTIGKRVRTETGIAVKDVSVSRAAYEIALSLHRDLFDKQIALIGGGKMASILMAAFKQQMTQAQLANITIVNRNEERLKMLMEKFGFDGTGWDQLEQVIQRADVLFVATGAPHVVLQPDDFALSGDQNQKLILDISVPRNVNPAVGDLPGVRLINTDDLGEEHRLSPEAQSSLISHAERIIEEEYAVFYRWFIARPTIATITQLRSKIEQIRQEELEAVAVGKKPDEQTLNLWEQWSRSLINRILHEPIVRLKAAPSKQHVSHHTAVINHLFDIDFETPEPPPPEKPTLMTV